MRDDRGAVAILVALLMVPLLGFAAVSVDVSALYFKRQQLQTGADAAALAVAQYCNQTTGGCGTPSDASATSLAQSMTNQNAGTNPTVAAVTTLTTSKVTVRNTTVKQHAFAPVLGIASTTVTASATAGFGSPIGGTAVIPLAFSWCEWKAQTGGGLPSATTPYTVYLSKTSSVTTNCTGPSNLLVPGGFGWLKTNASSCHATSAIGDLLLSDPGNSVPSSCSTTDLAAAVNHTVLLPIFDQITGTGNGAQYRVYGYAAFVTSGYFFGSQNSYNAPCNGNDRCIRGYFAKFVDTSEAFDYGVGGPPLGASIISLSS